MRLSLCFLLLIGSVVHADDVPMTPQDDLHQLVVSNRILAKINGKTISVLDVMKRMDVALNRFYPQYVNSNVAKFQFYSTQWRSTLSHMIDSELMIADAEKLEVKVSDGEVREEMMQRFGPNIMHSLEKIGMSYDEAREMVHADMIVQRMSWYRINSKAFNQVNSRDIKKAYRALCEKQKEQQQWEYQVLSFRATKPEIAQKLSQKAHQLLAVEGADFGSVLQKIKQEVDESPDVTLNISPEYKVDEKNLSIAHKEVLSALVEGAFSPPVSQLSRADNQTVYRIFHLKKHDSQPLPQFEKISEKLRDQLLSEAAGKEATLYIEKLRKKYGYDEAHMAELIPADFQPFMMR